MDTGQNCWFFQGVEYPSRSAMCVARRVEYVRLICCEGLNYTQAARVVGVSKRTGKVWRNGRTRSCGRNEKASVVISQDWYREYMTIPDTIHSRFLSLDQRLQIADGLAHKDSYRTIASRLGVHVSSVSREIQRNTNPATDRYDPYYAHKTAAQRRERPKNRKILSTPGLWDEVYDRVVKHFYSPQQASHDLVASFPDNTSMRASTETIYQTLYLQARGSMKYEIMQALRHHHPQRKKHSELTGTGQRFREPMIMISDRPASVADRAIPGHWEGDLICGAKNQSAIATLVERTTRFTLLVALPHGHTAGQVQDAIIHKMRDLPDHIRRSLTWDQGSEMAQHTKISVSLDMRVYFCNPHSPWQRGTNENTNGLLRQYFPKGTNLNEYDDEYLQWVEQELNNRPRKVLGWAKPSQKILEVINNNEYTKKQEE